MSEKVNEGARADTDNWRDFVLCGLEMELKKSRGTM